MFMSPEQCRFDEVNDLSDIYSLGAAYYTLLVGRPPYEGDQPVQVMFAHCSGPVPDPRNVLAEVPEPCARIVRLAMEKNPADRFASAAAMLADLEEVLAEPGRFSRNSLSMKWRKPFSPGRPARFETSWQHWA